MIKTARYQNYKSLRLAELPLSRFTLIVGPNGSGKSTALRGLPLVGDGSNPFDQIVTAGLQSDGESPSVAIEVEWGPPNEGVLTKRTWTHRRTEISHSTKGDSVPAETQNALAVILQNTRIYSLNPDVLTRPVAIQPTLDLAADGSNLAAVLHQLRDEEPERFHLLSEELGRWIPEFDKISFQTQGQGSTTIKLRTRHGLHSIQAAYISQGTLLALAFLTLAYLPRHPAILCLEEPDRGIHPRLLREVRDGLYRLSYPEKFEENREPVQVLATTHSPYFLDLYRDHPEEVVIAHKIDNDSNFQRLSELPHIEEILKDSHLGDAWYSGVLGGIPAGT